VAALLVPSALLLQPADATTTPLIGTFTITAGSCSGGTASGTYVRMVLSGGTNAAGPYFSNSDSTCSDNTYTLLSPGSSGGLVTGSYQSQPSPAFDASGNSLSSAITEPVAFEGVNFSTATNAVDPQTGLHVPAPSIEANGTTLTGNLQSVGVSWNNQEFNQGSPKPDGSAPANTTPVSGTYDPSTGAYTLQWSSQIVGGPFNGFSGFWNLTGRFIPSAAGGEATPPGTPPASPGTPTTSGASQSAAAGTGAARSAGGSGPVTNADVASSSTTTTTTSVAAAAPKVARGHTRTVLTTRTITTGATGWHAPIWLVGLVAVLGALGVAGALLSERALRRQRQPLRP